jgi:hypothetical protein
MLSIEGKLRIMPIPFACPHCGLQTEVAEQYAGHSGPCAGCGRTITVPSLRPSPPYLPPPSTKRMPAILAILLITVGGVIALVICSGLLAALGWTPERVGRF